MLLNTIQDYWLQIASMLVTLTLIFALSIAAAHWGGEQ